MAGKVTDSAVLIVEDGVPGGIQRAVEYLVDEWGDSPDAPTIKRIELRGAGNLRSSVPVFVGALLRIARQMVANRPRLIHLNVTQRGSSARSLAVVVLARVGRVPVLLHLHSSEYESFIGGLPRPALWTMRWMFRSADRVVVLGDAWADFVHRELRVDRGRLLVLRNAVPGPACLKSDRAPGSLRLLFLGQLGSRKGVANLLEALAQPEVAALGWEATLAGDGDVERFHKQAQQLGIADRVRLTGWIDRPEVERLLETSDILVLPSYAEGLPLSLLEGLAHGLAAIATPVGAVGEVIRNEATGLLVPPGDVAALAAALHRLITNDELRGQLAANGRAVWEREHSVPVYARRMAALYEEIAPVPR